MKRAPRDFRAGMSLVEVLAGVFLLAVTINLLMSASASAWRMQSVGTEALDRLRGVREVDRAFRACVRGAGEIVPGAGRFTTGPDCVVFRSATHPGGFVVFGTIEEPTRVGWIEIRENGRGWETLYHRRFAQPFRRIHFSFPSRAVAQLDLVVQYDTQEKPADPPVYRIIAAPRNQGERRP